MGVRSGTDVTTVVQLNTPTSHILTDLPIIYQIWTPWSDAEDMQLQSTMNILPEIMIYIDYVKN